MSAKVTCVRRTNDDDATTKSIVWKRNEKRRAGYGGHGHSEAASSASILFFASDIMAPAKAISSFGPAIIVLVLAVGTWSSMHLASHLRNLDRAISTAGSCPLSGEMSSQDQAQSPMLSRSSEKYISLVLPAYNEEARLSITLDEMLGYLQERAGRNKSFTYEIIVVDDGSMDKTVDIALEYASKYSSDLIRILKQGVNQGKGAATRKGMLCSRGELLLMLDSDGATRFADLEKLETQLLLSMAEQDGSVRGISIADGDVIPVSVWGSRAHLEKQALATRKWYRNILMKGFHLCVRLVAGGGIRDTQCGFKMFTRAAAQQLFSNMRIQRWTFDVELLYLCKRLHIPVREVAVTWTEIPGSKVNPLSIAHMLVELCLIRVGYGLQYWKILTSPLQKKSI